MYHTILVPLDGSKRAEAILPHVEELAKRYDAEVILMQVMDFSLVMWPTGSFPGQTWQELLTQIGERAESYLAQAGSELRAKGIKARTLLAEGPEVEAIVTAAEREGADLVALASHGRTGLAQVFYGSVAAGVLHRIDRPLLLIRSQNAG